MDNREVVLCILLALLSLEDVRKKKIHLWPIPVFLLWQLGFLVFTERNLWMDCLCGLAIGLVFCMVSMLSEGVIGIGDGLVICLLGFYIGARKVLIVLTVAFFLSGLAAMVYIALKKGKTARLPLIPYIYVGYVLSVSNGFGCGEVI